MQPLEDIIRENCPPLAPLPTGMEPRLNKLEGVKAVLFDVYGTLFVSGSGDVGTAAATDTAEALTQALAAAGFEGELEQAGQEGKQMLKEEILKRHRQAREAGIDYPEVEIRDIWKSIIASIGFLKSGDPDRLALEYECRANPGFPMPGSLETINALRENGLVIGIVSNAQFYTPLLFSAFFGKTVAQLGFDPDCCIWSFKEGKAKPSKDLFPKAGKFLMEKHGIGLYETVYVGNDMLNDVFCAQKAGCRTVLFVGDRRSLRMRENDARCLAVQPDAVIVSLSELLEIL
jgi:putative hydrolase of the HAD superfamily